MGEAIRVSGGDSVALGGLDSVREGRSEAQGSASLAKGPTGRGLAREADDGRDMACVAPPAEGIAVTDGLDVIEASASVHRVPFVADPILAPALGGVKR